MALTLYGIHPVLAALRVRPRAVHRVILARRAGDPAVAEILEIAQRHRIAVERNDNRGLSRMLGNEQHQGVLADVEPFPLADLDDTLRACRRSNEKIFFLVLDALQDPQNVGALIRSAVCCGVQAVLFPKDRAAPLSPAVAKASAGAIEQIRLCRVVNIAASITHLQQHGIWVAGCAPQAQRTIYDFDFDCDLALVIGAEGRGLRPLTAKTCDELLAIPMRGACQSLNASAAGAVALFEAMRQRHYA